mmetsp:Transcript_65751/g.116739  ORF Transcript_65751/g.116739 Transcript_65751/m.116739 type:complete len:525 (+) Transcript_65751:85-1659(+)
MVFRLLLLATHLSFLAVTSVFAVGSAAEQPQARWRAAADESVSKSSAGQHLMRVEASNAALLAGSSVHGNISLTYGNTDKLAINASGLNASGLNTSGVNVSGEEGRARTTSRGLSENFTEAVIEQAILSMRGRYEVLAVLITSTTCALAAIAVSAILILSHLQVGSSLSGFYIPHSSSATYIGLVWSLPLFALLGIAGIILPELLPIWQFLETLLLAGTFSRMPDVLVQVAGGRLELQLRLNSRLSADARDADLSDSSEVEATGTMAAHIFKQWPLCCFSRFVPQGPVQLQHVAPLHFTVTLICYMLPIMSFMKLFWSLEVEIGSPSAQEWFTFCAPWVIFAMRLLEMLSIAAGLSALNGLETVVTALSPQAASVMELPVKLLYCQSYLICLRLVPVFFGLIPLWGFSEVPEPRVLEAVRSVIVCIASLLCACLAWYAFPPDERHYPELRSANSEIRPVLDQVKFCPFCGSDELELNVQSLGAESVHCLRCCAHDVPMRLVISRGSLQKRAEQNRKGAGVTFDS